jgi:hypothetical protein
MTMPKVNKVVYEGSLIRPVADFDIPFRSDYGRPLPYEVPKEGHTVS